MFLGRTGFPFGQQAAQRQRNLVSCFTRLDHVVYEHMTRREIGGGELFAVIVAKPGGHFGAPVRRFAIALGCEVRHAGALVYADNLDLSTPAAFEPIGISCRICERTNCHQRAIPPLERRLSIPEDTRGVLPYDVA